MSLSSVSGLVARCRERLVRQRLCRFSSASDIPSPLFLWLGENQPSTTSVKSPSLLLPTGIVPPSQPTVFSPEDVVKQVNFHYDSDTHFVGGMGEEDPGVWFASLDLDPLAYGEIVQESIELVKEERHGVPFSLCTTGMVAPTVPLSELGLSTLHVSLYAGSPSDFAKATGQTERDFGMLCGFIVEAVEQGIPTEVWALEAYASGARDLAVSLGAQHIHIVGSSR